LLLLPRDNKRWFEVCAGGFTGRLIRARQDPRNTCHRLYGGLGGCDVDTADARIGLPNPSQRPLSARVPLAKHFPMNCRSAVRVTSTTVRVSCFVPGHHVLAGFMRIAKVYPDWTDSGRWAAIAHCGDWGIAAGAALDVQAPSMER
jgi:hypothetical protein